MMLWLFCFCLSFADTVINWIHRYCHIKLALVSMIKLSFSTSIREKILVFNLFFFSGMCKSRLNSMEESTNFQPTKIRFFISLCILTLQGFRKCSSEDFLICFSRFKIIQTSFGHISTALGVQEIIFGSPVSWSSSRDI